MTHYRIDDYGYLTGVDTAPRDDSTWVTTAPPSVDDGQFARWNGSSWETTAEPSPLSFEPAIATLWQQADELAQQIADQNARARYLAWLIDPDLPAPARRMIMQVQAAMDAVWTQYAAAKATVEAGQTPDDITLPKSWPSFWDIAEAANP